MSSIFQDDSWSVGEAKVDNLPLIIRARSSLPSGPDRKIYEHLIIITWQYTGNEYQMPPPNVNQQMQAFEDALEVALEVKEVGVQAACLTGKGAKEWRYYTYDKDKFMDRMNRGLGGHPAYPLELSLFADPEWNALSELVVSRQSTIDGTG